MQPDDLLKEFVSPGQLGARKDLDADDDVSFLFCLFRHHY